MKKAGKLVALLAGVFFIANIALLEIASAGEEQRKPPPTRSSDVLSDQVFRAINEVQELMSPEDDDDEPDYEAAKV